MTRRTCSCDAACVNLPGHSKTYACSANLHNTGCDNDALYA